MPGFFLLVCQFLICPSPCRQVGTQHVHTHTNVISDHICAHTQIYAYIYTMYTSLERLEQKINQMIYVGVS